VAINKSGDLAGALTTPDGIANLFVYHGNKFALLIPRSTHHAAAMAAFNNRAMVAGITDGAQAGLQYAAVWTAKGVAALGAWPTTDAVTITAMNTSGTLLLNVSDPTTKTQSAYKATCTGC
jgi:hypothetical protein